MAVPQTNQVGSFIPTTNIWDVSQVYALPEATPEMRELLVRLYQNLNLMAININTKDSGYYDTSEFVNGKLWFPNPLNTSATQAFPAFRQDYRKVINLPPTSLPTGIPLAGIVVPHGITITPKTTFTQIYGVANDTINRVYRPLPYVSAVPASNISLAVVGPNVVITPEVAYVNVNQIYVVLEYLQS